MYVCVCVVGVGGGGQAPPTGPHRGRGRRGGPPAGDGCAASRAGAKRGGADADAGQPLDAPLDGRVPAGPVGWLVGWLVGLGWGAGLGSVVFGWGHGSSAVCACERVCTSGVLVRSNRGSSGAGLVSCGTHAPLDAEQQPRPRCTGAGTGWWTAGRVGAVWVGAVGGCCVGVLCGWLPNAVARVRACVSCPPSPPHALVRGDAPACPFRLRR
jgi:hypothetical protein